MTGFHPVPTLIPRRRRSGVGAASPVRRVVSHRRLGAESGHLCTLGRTGRVHSKLAFFWSAMAHRARRALIDRPVACLSSLHKRLVQATASPVSVGADSVFADPRTWAPEFAALSGPRPAVQGQRIDWVERGLSTGVRTGAAPHFPALTGWVAPAWGRSDHRLK